MAFQVCSGAVCQCNFGSSPSALMVLPDKRVVVPTPAATIMDSKPNVNVLPFGMCSSPSNPGVIAALGAPVPCTPVTSSPWVVGAPTVLLGNQPALNNTAKLVCSYSGVIQVVAPGQFTTMIP